MISPSYLSDVFSTVTERKSSPFPATPSHRRAQIVANKDMSGPCTIPTQRNVYPYQRLPSFHQLYLCFVMQSPPPEKLASQDPATPRPDSAPSPAPPDSAPSPALPNSAPSPALPDPAPVTITPCPDTLKWNWLEESQKHWNILGEHEEYAVFYRYWRNPTSCSSFSNKFPYPLPLGVVLTASPTGIILVTKAYDKMYCRLLDLRERDREGPPVRGAVVTGQPGIGALQPDLHTT